MSPRRTEALHEISHGEHLRPISLVGVESGNLGGQGLFVTKPPGRFDKCCTNRLRAAHA